MSLYPSLSMNMKFRSSLTCSTCALIDVLSFSCLCTGRAPSVVRAQRPGSGDVSIAPYLGACLWPPARILPRGTVRSALTRETKSKVNVCVCVCACDGTASNVFVCEYLAVVHTSEVALNVCLFFVCSSQVWINVVCVCILVICVGMSVYVCLQAVLVCKCMCLQLKGHKSRSVMLA